MVRYTFLILIILLETFQTVYSVSGNDSFNLSGPKSNKITELTNSKLSSGKGFLFQNNETPSGEKIVEKRRLLYDEDEISSPTDTVRDYENEYSTRRTNYSVTETETQVPEYRKGFSSWENKQNMFFPNHGSRIHSGFHLRQPNSNQMSEQRSDTFETTQETHWNGEKNVEHSSNMELGSRTGGRFSHGIHDDFNGNIHSGRNGELFNRRLSLDHGMVVPKRYNNERVGDLHRGYFSDSDIRYYHKDPKRFWKSTFYRPEKGVIINFNTECPATRQLNDQMVPKFIITPKTPMSTVPQISSCQIPETTFMTPTYYL